MNSGSEWKFWPANFRSFKTFDSICIPHSNFSKCKNGLILCRNILTTKKIFGLPKWNWILNFNKQSRCLMDFGMACDSFIAFVLYYIINALSISEIHTYWNISRQFTVFSCIWYIAICNLGIVRECLCV